MLDTCRIGYAPTMRYAAGDTVAARPFRAAAAPDRYSTFPALLFLYRHVLGSEVGELGEAIRARKPIRLPVVITRDEVKAVLGPPVRRQRATGLADARRGPEAHGAPAATCPGPRLFTQRDPRPRRPGREGPDHHAARVARGPAAARAPEECEGDPGERSCEGLGPCPHARCPGPQIPRRTERMAMAIRATPSPYVQAFLRNAFARIWLRH